jgi:hypothetical protein
MTPLNACDSIQRSAQEAPPSKGLAPHQPGADALGRWVFLVAMLCWTAPVLKERAGSVYTDAYKGLRSFCFAEGQGET